MFRNRSDFLPQMLKTALTIGAWVGVYLVGSCVYFSLTYNLVEITPALLIPLLMPLGALSACVSWQIEEAIGRVKNKNSARNGKASILPLLYMSIFYSSVVEGFLYEWFLHGGLRPWLRIGLDLLWLSPFFTDAAATYIYERLLGKDHEAATKYVSERLPSFIIPLLGFWLAFSVAGNVAPNPIMSFMIFDFGIIVWTVFFTWANHTDLPLNLRTSQNSFLRRLGILNELLSRPLGRIYRWQFFGSYLLDLLILIYALAIASELWLAGVASLPTLATIIAVTFALWKVREFRIESRRLPVSKRTLAFRTRECKPSIDRTIGIMEIYSPDSVSLPGRDGAQLVLKLDDPVLTLQFPADNPRHISQI